MMKYFLALLVISLVIFTSGCTSNNNSEINQTQTFSQNGVFFEYPGNWVVATSQANDTIVSVADPNSINAITGYADTSVTIQQRTLTGTLYSMYEENYDILFTNESYQRVFESNITLDDSQAYENIYQVDENGVLKQQRAVWLEKNNQVYVILCSALVNQFEKEKQNFNLIINTFRVN